LTVLTHSGLIVVLSTIGIELVTVWPRGIKRPKPLKGKANFEVTLFLVGLIIFEALRAGAKVVVAGGKVTEENPSLCNCGD